jgi:hypothetical protein
MLRRIFGTKREEVTGGWRKLHEELHSLYSSSNIIRIIKSRWMRWTKRVARMGSKYIKSFGRDTAGKRPLGRPRRRYRENIKIDVIK